MSFYRTMQFGVLGAALALAAVPNAAHAEATVYSDYTSWASNAGSAHEVTQLCTQPYGSACGLPVTVPAGTVYPDSPGYYLPTPPVTPTVVPLVWLRTAGKSTPQVNLLKPSGIAMYRNVLADIDPYGVAWSTFWPPNDLTGGPFKGDLWVSNIAKGNGQPLTSISLQLSSPLTSFGFEALPIDSSQQYDLTMTLNDGASETELVGGSTCTATGTNPVTSPANPCGFFGYTGGDGITSITLSYGTPVGCETPGHINSDANFPSTCSQGGGFVLGDFLAGPVPEPASMAILGVGLTALGAIRRRRRS